MALLIISALALGPSLAIAQTDTLSPEANRVFDVEKIIFPGLNDSDTLEFVATHIVPFKAGQAGLGGYELDNHTFSIPIILGLHAEPGPEAIQGQEFFFLNLLELRPQPVGFTFSSLGRVASYKFGVSVGALRSEATAKFAAWKNGNKQNAVFKFLFVSGDYSSLDLNDFYRQISRNKKKLNSPRRAVFYFTDSIEDFYQPLKTELRLTVTVRSLPSLQK